MKAMIFAAGLGTRLRPLTDDRPKALVEVGGMPLLEIALRRLKHFGVREVIINVHHFAARIESFLARNHNFGLGLAISDERDLLLDTGGGLRKAAWFFDDGAPFLLLNADIVTDLDLNAFYKAHLDKAPLATLAIRNRPASRQLLFDEVPALCGWRNNKTGEEKWCRPGIPARPYAFSGIQVVSPGLFRYFPEKPVFSMIDLYLRAGSHGLIRGYLHDEDHWIDVGKPAALEQAGELVAQLRMDRF